MSGALKDPARDRAAEVGEGVVAVLNAGSSSIKFAVYRGPQNAVALRGRLEKIGVEPTLQAIDGAGKMLEERHWPSGALDHRAGTAEIIHIVRQLMAGTPVAAVGHRVVHGGTRYAAPVRVDARVIAELRALVPLAPLHQPHNLAPIEAIAEGAPSVPQVACFDTAFHRAQPPLAQMFALPRRLTEAGVRRYGFHGLSYEFVAGRLTELAPELARGRVVVAHLGNGASLCALKAGRPVATTMGFTAVDGLMMGTRCGAVDPGVLIYLMDTEGLDARGLEALVYTQSGLLGVSGVSSDMRELRASKAPEAAEAIALFVYRAQREIGSLAAALDGLDAVVFTGGIGENDAAARAEIAAGCGWLGLRLDPDRNASGVGRISAEGAAVAAWVIPTDEEGMIARHTRTLLTSAAPELTASSAP
jgi:acetate kinase